MSRRVLASALAVTLAALGCAGSDKPATPSAGTSVGPTGGTVEAGGVRMLIPAGALATTEAITVTTVDVDPGAGFGRASPVYKFTPEGLTFAQPVTVTIEAAGAVARPAIFWSRPGGGYDALPSTRDGNEVTAQTTHFSTAFVGALPATALRVDTSAVALTATQGSPGSAAQVVLSDANGGTLSGVTAQVTYQDGQGWLTATASGTAVTLQPTAAALAAGTYRATVQVSADHAEAPQSIAVTLTVAPRVTGPVLTLGASSANFTAVAGGTNPPSQQILTGQAAGLAKPTLTVSYANAPSGWLDVAVTGTTSPWAIVLQPRTGQLAAGSYDATVAVASAGATGSPKTIAVRFTVNPPPPRLLVSVSSVTFQEVVNVAANAQTFQVTNGGGGQLGAPQLGVTYAAGGATGWLDHQVSGTSAPYTVTVRPNTATLSVGTYAATLRVSVAGALQSPKDVPITFRVTAVPEAALLLTPSALAFDASTIDTAVPTQFVAVSNGGDPTIPLATPTIDASGIATWATAAIAPAGRGWRVSVSPLAPTAGLVRDVYQGTVKVLSANAVNSPQEIAVTYVVHDPPIIVPSVLDLAFSAGDRGAVPPAQVVTLLNGGEGTLAQPTWTVLYPEGGPTGWLDATVASGAEGWDVSVRPKTVLPYDLAPYTATLRLECANAETRTVELPVSYTIEWRSPPELAVDPSVVTLEVVASPWSDPASTKVAVTNAGGRPFEQPVDAVVTAGGDWLAATATGLGDTWEIDVTAASAGLEPGTYEGAIEVSSTGADNSPLTIPVLLTVLAEPSLVLTPPAVAFQARPEDPPPALAEVILGNGGGGTLETPGWTVEYLDAESGWLDVNVTDRGDGTWLVTLGPVHTALPEGAHLARVQLTSANAAEPAWLDVTYEILPPPHLVASATQVDFATVSPGGSDPEPQRVTVLPSPGAQLGAPLPQVEYLSGDGWLEVQLSSGDAPWWLDLSPQAAGLDAGTYAADVVLTAAGAVDERRVRVVLTVDPDPGLAIAVAPAAAWFFQDPLGAAQERVLFLSAPEALAFEPVVSPGVAWLDVFTSPVAGGWELRLLPNDAVQAPGTYETVVQVDVPGASNRVEVPVRYEIADYVATPSLQVDRQWVDMQWTPRVGPAGTHQQVVALNSGSGLLPPPRVEVSYGGDVESEANPWLRWEVAFTTPEDTSNAWGAGYEVRFEVDPRAVPTNVLDDMRYAYVTLSCDPFCDPSTSVVDVTVALAIENLPERMAVGSSRVPPFRALAGGAPPAAQLVTVFDEYTLAPLPYGWYAAIDYDEPGADWLAAESWGDAAEELRVRTTDLEPGLHGATVWLNTTSEQVDASPQALHVRYAVAGDAPILFVDDAPLRFVVPEGGAAAPAQLLATNEGAGVLDPPALRVRYCAARTPEFRDGDCAAGSPAGAPTGWLSATTIALGGEAHQLVVTARAEAQGAPMPAGRYAAVLEVTSATAANVRRIPVTMVVTGAGPQIVLSDEEIQLESYGYTFSSRIVDLVPVGATPLDPWAGVWFDVTYAEGEPQGWLDLPPDGYGRGPFWWAQRFVAPAQGELPPGLYTAWVDVSLDGIAVPPQRLTVRYRVR